MRRCVNEVAVVKGIVSSNCKDWSEEPVMFDIYCMDESMSDVPLSVVRELHKHLGILLASEKTEKVS